MATERVFPPLEAQERTMLEAWLDFHRDTLAVKCEGLTDEQLRERAVPPSVLSLLGLIRHMAEGERQWFGIVLAGEPEEYHYYGHADSESGSTARSAREHEVESRLVEAVSET